MPFLNYQFLLISMQLFRSSLHTCTCNHTIDREEIDTTKNALIIPGNAQCTRKCYIPYFHFYADRFLGLHEIISYFRWESFFPVRYFDSANDRVTYTSALINASAVMDEFKSVKRYRIFQRKVILYENYFYMHLTTLSYTADYIVFNNLQIMINLISVQFISFNSHQYVYL